MSREEINTDLLDLTKCYLTNNKKQEIPAFNTLFLARFYRGSAFAVLVDFTTYLGIAYLGIASSITLMNSW